MSGFVEFAYVWREEQDILARLAGSVPRGGVIVEIGTALGGTALIMWRSACDQSVDIYTVDLFPCRRAKSNLLSTGVHIINDESAAFAARWPEADGRPIDLLYIDGDHSLAGIYKDFESWISLVRPGGTVAFHDYDPPARGHLAHLSVGIFLDTVRKMDLLDGMHHEFKLLQGTKRRSPIQIPSVGNCFEMLQSMAEKARSTRNTLFRGSVADGMQLMRERSAPLNSLEACVCVAYALREDFECLDVMTNDFHAFRRNVETLSFLDHAYGPSLFPDGLSDMPPPGSIAELSRLLASEQVRLRVLADILRTLVPWNP